MKEDKNYNRWMVKLFSVFFHQLTNVLKVQIFFAMDQVKKFKSAISATAKIFTTDHKIFQVYIQSPKRKTIEKVDFKFVTENKTFVINLSLKYKLFYIRSGWSTNHDELKRLIENIRLKDNFIDQVI